MSDEAITVAKEFLQAINRQDPDWLAGLMTPDHRFVDSLGHSASGREGVKEGWRLYFQMVPDYRLGVEETYVQEGAVVMLGMARGTYSHAFEDVQAMGMPNRMKDSGSREPKNWETPAAVRAKVVDGKVAEWRVFADNEPLRRLMRNAS